MKKTSLYILAGVLMLSSCSLDINENPNYPSASDVSADLVFPSVENFIADCVGDQMFNYGGFFAQYWDQMPTANQYNDLAELNINESKDLFNRCYTYLYAGALMDIEDVKSKTTNTADLFACAVLRAYAFQLVVDNLGYAPYTEALSGASNAMPAWDKGEDVYKGVLAELDAAEGALSDNVMTVTDPMLNKNVAQWKGFANALRLRMLFRLVDGGIDVSANQQKIKDIVSQGEFFSGNITWDVYQNSEGQYNPWYDGYKSLGAKNHCAAYPLVSYYMATSDPRIDYVLSPRSLDNTYFGQMPGAKTNEFQWIGIATAAYQDNYVSNINYSVANAMPVYLYTQAELQFLIAEAELRFNSNDAASQIAYEAGVVADFIDRGLTTVDASAFLQGKLVKWDGDQTQKLDMIYRQKWVALFFRDHMEAWTEARRTDVPALSSMTGEAIFKNAEEYTPGDFIVPTTNYSEKKGLCLSVPFPSSARKLNKNTPAAHTISERVFWDAK